MSMDSGITRQQPIRDKGITVTYKAVKNYTPDHGRVTRTTHSAQHTTTQSERNLTTLSPITPD